MKSQGTQLSGLQHALSSHEREALAVTSTLDMLLTLQQKNVPKW